MVSPIFLLLPILINFPGLANHNPTFLFNRLVVNLFEPLQDLMSIAGPIERKDRLIGDFIEVGADSV